MKSCDHQVDEDVTREGHPNYSTAKANWSGPKNSVLRKCILLLSLSTFLLGYLTASSHYMVNHMDFAFRLQERDRNSAMSLDRRSTPLKSLPKSIIANFRYTYISDSQPWINSDGTLIHTHDFSKFARGWILSLFFGQGVGCCIAWKLTEVIGRRKTIVISAGFIFFALCLQFLFTPDHNSFVELVFSTETQPTVEIYFKTLFFVLAWTLRFVFGIFMGVMEVAAILYASELPLPQQRGYFMSFLPVAYIFGIWLCLIVTLLLHYQYGTSRMNFLSSIFSWEGQKSIELTSAVFILGNEWRSHLIVPFLGTVMLFFSFLSGTNSVIMTPDSPYWLLANDSTTMPTASLTMAESRKKFLSITRQQVENKSKDDSSGTVASTMDAYSSLLLLRGGGKSPTILREVSVEFSNMYRALAQDAVSDQSWRNLCFGTNDISLRYRLLLLCILMVSQVVLGPHLLFRLSKFFSILLLDNDPYGTDDSVSRDKAFMQYQFRHHESFWFKYNPSYSYLFEGLIASCIILSSLCGLLIGREYLDPVVLRSGYSRGESIGRRSMLITGISFMVLFLLCLTLSIHFHQWEYDEFATMRTLFWQYLIKYLCFGWLCFICFSYYASFGLVLWILPVEVWGLRHRSKCLSATLMVYYLVLCLCYIGSFQYRTGYADDISFNKERMLAPSSLQWRLLLYAMAVFGVGVYIFLALPETTGIMFEDSDELFSLEEYDVMGLCFPRGSGSGFLGFRTFEQINLKFHIFFATSKPRPHQTQLYPYIPSEPLRSSSHSAFSNSDYCNIQGSGLTHTHPLHHSPVPIKQMKRSYPSFDSQVISSPQLIDVGPHMILSKAHGMVSGYGSVSSTPNSSQAAQQIRPSSADSGDNQFYLGSQHGSALFLPGSDESFDQTSDNNLYREHKYSTPLRSSGFQYLDKNHEEGSTIHTTHLFHTNTTNSNSQTK